MEGNRNVHSNRAHSRCAVHGSNIPCLLFSNSVYFTAATAAVFSTAVGDGGGGGNGGVCLFYGGKIHSRQYVVHIKKHFHHGATYMLKNL